MTRNCRFLLLILSLIFFSDLFRGQNKTNFNEFSQFEKIHQQIITAKNRDQAFAFCKKYIDLAKKRRQPSGNYLMVMKVHQVWLMIALV